METGLNKPPGVLGATATKGVPNPVLALAKTTPTSALAQCLNRKPKAPVDDEDDKPPPIS